MAEAGTNVLECLQEAEKSQSQRLYGRSRDERVGVSAGDREESKPETVWQKPGRTCWSVCRRQRRVKAGGCTAGAGTNALECLREKEKCQRAENFGGTVFVLQEEKEY